MADADSITSLRKLAQSKAVCTKALPVDSNGVSEENPQSGTKTVASALKVIRLSINLCSWVSRPRTARVMQAIIMHNQRVPFFEKKKKKKDEFEKP